jgi:hypothetical protein
MDFYQLLNTDRIRNTKLANWHRGWPLLYGALVVGFTSLFSHWAYDDPFITFRYADNLRSGLGFVYNPGERALSTTTPLYTILLAGLGFLWRDLPRLSNLISAMSLALGGVFLHIVGQRWREPLAGLVAAALFPFFPLMVSTFGAETCFYTMLILGAFALHTGGQHWGAMALTALATLTRSDGVLAATVLGMALWIERRRIPWQPLLLFALMIAPWYLFSWVYFGSPVPATLAAKQHQGQMAISDGFAKGFLGMLTLYARQPLYWLHGALIILGIGYAVFVSKARRWLLFLVWGALYFVSYVLLGVTRYYWYYGPLVPVFLVAIGLGVTALSRWLAPVLTGKQRAIKIAALVILLALLLWPQGEGLKYVYSYPDTRAHIYREIGEWVAESTPPDASVGTLEAGVIGYYARRRMVGFAGLIQPDVARQMTRESTYQDTAIWAVQRYHPDYLVLDPQWFPVLMNDVVSSFCSSRQTFANEEYAGELIVYECDWTE